MANGITKSFVEGTKVLGKKASERRSYPRERRFKLGFQSQRGGLDFFQGIILFIIMIVIFGSGGLEALGTIGGVLAKIPPVVWLVLILIFLWNSVGGAPKRKVF